MLTTLPAANALAQISTQIAIASDNEFRGVSLNENRPAASLEIDYDNPDGWFAGGLVSQVHLFTQRHATAEYVVDAGYAHTLASGLTWETGATEYIFPNVSFYNYTETFVGLSSSNWSTRLYYAPDYFGRNSRTLYAEFNYVQPLDERWRLLGHIGYLRDGLGGERDDTHVFDASLGVGAKWNQVNVELKWIGTNRPNYLYPVAVAVEGGRSEWILSVAYAY